MLIVADRDIPLVKEAFGGLGEVRLVEGRGLVAGDVRDAEVLLVRSVTPVNAGLLEGSAVRFVGSATIGTDHLDLDYLRARGVAYAHAPGSNAQAVAEYVLSAMLALRSEPGPVGIVGYGNAGRRLARLLDALDVPYLVNDPPLRAAGFPVPHWAPLEDIRRTNIISLHVPLTKTGPHPTYHLVNEEFLRGLPPDCLLINTSRGSVVDNRALLRHLDNARMQTVLDVWEGEPAIDFQLLERVSLGTPHIAGYSREGKLNGTQQIHTALCAFLDVKPGWQPRRESPRQTLTSKLQGFAAIRNLVSQVYDIRRDDAELRRLTQLPSTERPAGFDRLRRTYPLRREFSAYRCRVENDGDTRRKLGQLGFVT